jgi:hypothetical protein
MKALFIALQSVSIVYGKYRGRLTGCGEVTSSEACRKPSIQLVLRLTFFSVLFFIASSLFCYQTIPR